MKINNVNELIVKYNDEVVGYLKELKDKRIAFQYSKSWIKNGFSISPLSLPLKDEIFISQSKYFNGLFGVFNDSLPDGWGELLFRRMLVKKGINIEKLSPLTRLSFVNTSSLGALRYYPINYNENENLDFDLDKLYIESSKIFKDENVNDLKENLLLIAEKWLVEHILKEDAKIEKWRQANLEHAEDELIEEQPKQYKYTCGCPHKIHLVPPHIHEKIVEGKKFSCMTCKVVIKIKRS